MRVTLTTQAGTSRALVSGVARWTVEILKAGYEVSPSGNTPADEDALECFTASRRVLAPRASAPSFDVPVSMPAERLARSLAVTKVA